MEKDFKKIYEGISIFKNKTNISRKQYNIALDKSLMKKIDKIQQTLQLKLNQYLGRAEVLEMILKRGLNSSEPSIAIDDSLYTFNDVEELYNWVFNDYFNEIKNYLVDLNTFEKIIQEVNKDIELLNISDKTKVETISEKNICSIDIEHMNKNVIQCFESKLYDMFILAGNDYYPLINKKYIDSIIPLDESIKISLYFYRQMKYKKQNYSKLSEKIKEFSQQNLEFQNEILKKIIIDNSIYCTKLLFSAEYDLGILPEHEEMFNNKENFKNYDINYIFKESTFSEENLIENDFYMHILEHNIEDYIQKYNNLKQ